MSLRKNLIVLVASTGVVILLALSILQIHWTNVLVIEQAVNRVKKDISSAWQVLDYQQDKITITTTLLSNSTPFNQFENKSALQRQKTIHTAKEQWDLDLLEVFDKDGRSMSKTSIAIGEYIIKRFSVPTLQRPISGYVNIPIQIMEHEDADLKENCSIRGKVVNTLFIFTLVPQLDSEGKPNGTMLAGMRLNNSLKLINQIHNNLFSDEIYKGKRIGTVTIFAGSLRVATTVLLDKGELATGTFVSQEVKNQVLVNEIPWTGRAEVVDTWYLSRYEPIRDPLGKVIGMLYIGELEQFYIDQKYNSVYTGVGVIFFILLLSFLISLILLRHNRRLEIEKNKVRFDFIRVLGHELKSPINAVEGYLQLIDQQIAGKMPIAYDKMISRSLIRIKFMRKLISDLLDLTRIESGQKKRELANVDIREIAQEAIETMSPLAKERSITINLLPDQAVYMIADRSDIEIIFNNLLSNAIKYNREKGHVEVSIVAFDNKVKISVKDTGIGMTEEEMKKLFGEFVRIKNEKTSKIPGTGLGLSIVKKITTLNNGETNVESKPGQGSTFTIILKRK